MEPEDVVEIVNALEGEGIGVWLDGGWGVDALVGEQTRPHSDLDVAVDRGELERVRDLLDRLGFRVDPSAEPARAQLDGRLADLKGEHRQAAVRDRP